MFENISEILKQISPGESSVLELKTAEFSVDKITEPHRNSMADTGVLLLGVDDKSRAILGIPLDKRSSRSTSRPRGNRKSSAWRETVCADFKKSRQEPDYATIVAVADKIPNNVLEEDPKLLMWYDQAVTRMDGE